MNIEEAQRDVSRAFVGGGPGVLVSALVWLAAALVERRHGIAPAFATLFFGGMLIFPVSMLVARLAFRRAKEAPGNPLGPVALESTVAMIGGLFAAWLLLDLRPNLVFPLAAIAVGTHYAVFKTIYGDRSFWVLAALLTALGGLAALERWTPPGGVILAVAVVEAAFAAVLTYRAWRPA